MAQSSNTGLLVLLAAAGAAAYYAYTQGWLSSIFGAPATTAPTPATPVTTTTTPAAPSVPAPTFAPTAITLTQATPLYSPQVLAALQSAGAGITVTQTPGNQPIPAGVTLGGPLSAVIAQQGANQGWTAAQINAAIAAAAAQTAGAPAGSLLGLGRTVLYFPRRGFGMALPRNYRMRRVA